MADDVIIPAAYEAISDVYIEHIGANDPDDKAENLVEPTEHLKETYQFMMDSTLVNITMTTMCKVQVLNSYQTNMVLNTTLRSLKQRE